MGVFFFLHGPATPSGRVGKLAREFRDHGLLRPQAGVLHDPPHGERDPAGGAHFARDLIGGTTDAPRPHFHDRLDLLQRLLEDVDGFVAGTLRAMAQAFESAGDARSLEAARRALAALPR